MTTAAFVATTVLVFDDNSVEGQILHVGTEQECRQAAHLISGVAYGGEKRITRAGVDVFPNAQSMKAGDCWTLPPQPSPNA